MSVGCDANSGCTYAVVVVGTISARVLIIHPPCKNAARGGIVYSQARRLSLVLLASPSSLVASVLQVEARSGGVWSIIHHERILHLYTVGIPPFESPGTPLCNLSTNENLTSHGWVLSRQHDKDVISRTKKQQKALVMVFVAYSGH